MNIYNYLIIVSQKDIPLHRDFNIYTKVLKQNKSLKLKASSPLVDELYYLQPHMLPCNYTIKESKHKQRTR